MSNSYAEFEKYFEAEFPGATDEDAHFKFKTWSAGVRFAKNAALRIVSQGAENIENKIIEDI